MQEGAQQAGQAVPPLIVHAPVCVHDNPEEVASAFREQLGMYPRLPHYASMFADAGYPEALATGQWSDAMQKSVLIAGNEEQVATGLRQLSQWGAEEILASVVTAGPDQSRSWDRSVRLLAQVGKGL